MNWSFDKAQLFPPSKSRLSHILTHSLLFVTAYTSPSLAHASSSSLSSWSVHTTHTQPHPGTRTQSRRHPWMYLRWHLARDTCSHCSLYLQPLKRIFQLTYESLQKYVCEVTFGLKKSSMCAGSWKCQNISSRMSSPANFNFWSSGWRRSAACVTLCTIIVTDSRCSLGHILYTQVREKHFDCHYRKISGGANVINSGSFPLKRLSSDDSRN